MSADALATAVIAAAGSGDRLGAGGPKALVEVAGRPLLEWSLAALRVAGTIGGVVIAAPSGYEEEVRALDGDATIIVGGSSRSESVANALTGVESELVVVHDAARPLASPGLFDAVVSELASDDECDAIVAAAPVVDTLKRALAGRVIETVPRSELWAIQTPQAFRSEVLREALDADAETLAAATDDASLIEGAGGVVRVFPWEEPNFKVTTRMDLAIAEALLRR
ncbi:MAG TPA: 2-C-methyl-D-erythritol 4-phosphate cytidylyltransferase [Solirubrobacterales bacterium]|nr:2-C-methyl-D-erythritol 4-phosphate cytidylyltransferase [Solirubrobacterales bacterium]